VEASLWVGMACAGADRLAAADRHLTRALRLARASGRRHLSVYVRCALGWVWCLLGRLGEADRCLSVAVDAARFTGSDELLVMTMAQRSWVLSWRRQEELARRLASEAATTAGMAGLRGGRVSVLAGAVLARAMADAGDRDGCAQLLRAAGGGSDLPEFDAVSRVTWLALLAEVEAERGDLMRAVAAAGVAEEVAGRLDLPGLTALAHQARACTVEPVQAARRQVSAAELFAGSGWRLHEGRARLRAAAALAVTGDDAGATEQLDLAEALLSRGEGRAHLDDVHRQRRRIGAQGPAGAALALLSEREREIVRMVAAGQTNREIAEVLFLSARTVEAHLTRIFGKLGVTSRVSLAALYAT
jgi:DNA-binding CsgD family transcriptional regulator